MTIALIRSDPKSMAKHVKNFKSHPMYTGQVLKPLVDLLVSMKTLPNVTMDLNACKACRNNTDKKISPDQGRNESFDLGGNAREFMGMLGDGKDVDTEEYTRLSWTGSAKDLVIFMLVDGFNTNKRHPILEENLRKVGVHMRAHKKHHNIF